MLILIFMLSLWWRILKYQNAYVLNMTTDIFCNSQILFCFLVIGKKLCIYKLSCYWKNYYVIIISFSNSHVQTLYFFCKIACKILQASPKNHFTLSWSVYTLFEETTNNSILLPFSPAPPCPSPLPPLHPRSPHLSHSLVITCLFADLLQIRILSPCLHVVSVECLNLCFYSVVLSCMDANVNITILLLNFVFPSLMNHCLLIYVFPSGVFCFFC